MMWIQTAADVIQDYDKYFKVKKGSILIKRLREIVALLKKAR